MKKMILRNWNSVVQVVAVLLLFVFLYAVLVLSVRGERPFSTGLLSNASMQAEWAELNCTPLFEEDRTRAYSYYVEASSQWGSGESIFERKFMGTDAGGSVLMASKTISKTGNTTLIEKLDAVTLECKGMEMLLESVNAKPSRQELKCLETKTGSFAAICEETFEKQGEEKVETFIGNITATVWENKREKLRVWKAEGINVPVKMEVGSTGVWTLAEYE
ncbi:hypothetical protein HY992_01900 [Candidatus Micrarchaeota archaeon]|nr:hypothetical protein [Candidatus Micrarchaeota archaeon]